MRSSPLARAVLVLLLVGVAACESTPSGSEQPPDFDALSSYLRSLPAWSDEAPEPQSPSQRSPIYKVENDLDYRCGVTEKNLVRTFEQLMAAGSDFSNLYPGALVEGNSVRSGTPRTLALPRAPMTLRINLPIAQQSVEVSDVSATSVAQAVADLQRAAASDQGTIDVVPADMVFDLAEASSFEQSMVEIGVSLAFAAPLRGVTAGGNLETSTTRSVRTHSVAVKFVQEMFTVEMADDRISDPAEFLGVDTTLDELLALQGTGSIGPDNIPLYVESVTYGRILMFSLRSTDVDQADELAAAMQASGSGLSGTANLTTRQREILSNANYQFVVFGGPQDAAGEAIANLDWRRFFTPAQVTTAVPIAFTVRTMNGQQRATIHDDVTYLERQGCEAPTSYTVNVNLTKVEHMGGTCSPCLFSSEIRRSGAAHSIIRGGAFQWPFLDPKTYDDSRTLSLAPGQRFRLVSAFGIGSFSMVFGYPGAVSASTNNMPLLSNGQWRTLTANANALAAEGRFTYRVRKTANW